MKIESVDLFYFSLPIIEDKADGSQDSFLVRIRADNGLEGFGESDSSPLVAFACYCCPMSHSNIVNIRQSLLGRTIASPRDIRETYRYARRRALDMAHFPHAYAAADIALWDLLGKKENTPVYRLLGYDRQLPKRAYASYLFQDTPEETRALAAHGRESGFTAAKFGWGPMGRRGEEFDVALVRGAREGLGADAALMVDAGTIWEDDCETVLRRAAAFAEFDVTWLEEPFLPEAVDAYGRAAGRSAVPLAAGEGCDSVRAAEDLLVNGRVSYLQIDPGRIGGITPAFEALQLAKRHGATFVNHTYKSHVSLAAAMAVFAGESSALWAEFCESGSPLVQRIVAEPLRGDDEGQILLPERAGLGMDVDLASAKEFAHDVSITIDGRTIGSSAT